MSEKIYILDETGQWAEAATLDEAIKEQVKKNERRDTERNDGDDREDEGEAGELASDDVQSGGEDTVVQGHDDSSDCKDHS